MFDTCVNGLKVSKRKGRSRQQLTAKHLIQKIRHPLVIQFHLMDNSVRYYMTGNMMHSEAVPESLDRDLHPSAP